MDASNPDDSAARRTQVWIAVIAAVGGIIVAAIGLAGTLLATNSSITANEGTPAPTVTTTVTVQAPDPTATQPTPGELTGAQPKGKIYHQGRVSLAAQGQSADFEAPPDDPRWSEGVSENQIEILFYGALSMHLDVFVVPRGSEASYAYCSLGTLYAPYDSADSDEITQGTVFCARGDSGRFGSIHVVKKSEKQWTLDITTWTL